MRETRMKALAAALAAMAMLAAPGAHAADLLVTYIAKLGEADHYNSRGERLTEVWQVIRQDRANFHRFGIGDLEDEGDDYFHTLAGRAELERLVIDGWRYADLDKAAVHDAIVNGTPTVAVGLWQDGTRRFVTICNLTGELHCLN